MVFALSAMSREKMKYCVRNLSTVMRDGQRGAICIRDYAVGDLAQERFEGKVGASQKLSENFYVRHDGTRAYYFTKDDLVALFAEEGMAMREVFLCQRMITNRADALDMNRRWIQGHFASATNMPTSFTPPERPKATTPWGN
jgi:methyltransferase-like protein 6